MTKQHVDYLRLLEQDDIWVDGRGRMLRLDDLSPDYRANLIPFLRRRARALQSEAWRVYWATSLLPDEVADRLEADLEIDPQEWMSKKPLMIKLLQYERERSQVERKLTAIKNKAYEIATGYRKKG